MLRPPPTAFVATILLAGAAAAAPSCQGSLVGNPCGLDGGIGEADVHYEQGSPACDGDVCISLLGSDPYCTSACGEDGDCPSGFACQEVDLSPAGTGTNVAKLCVDETPPGGDDDDDTVPFGCEEGIWGSPATLSDLDIVPRDDGQGCVLDLGLTWHDEDGDLNAASSVIRFGDVQFEGIFEVADTTDARLTLTVPMVDLQPATAYDVEVRIRDRGCNWSNTLEAPGYVTPDASCQ